ncbi:MAG: glycosyltransferase family 4 protein [Nostoc sp.]|uniref:glycosyltransferase n=1 Tax=Nostoc sp. TaxID=1180 RepID=UPI002FF51538
MEKLVKDHLSLWRAEGSQIIQENFKLFRSLVADARKFAHQGNYNTSAAYAEMAAIHAGFKHSGLFASQDLEQVLLLIGQKAISNPLSISQRTSPPELPKHVLHVATDVTYLSGPPRFLGRWMQQEHERIQSLFLTKQSPDEVPQTLRDIIGNRHGKIYGVSDKSDGNYIVRAQHLRQCAANVDVVVLHLSIFDIIPSIAFANKEQLPPVIYVNHGDHWFWPGVSISNVVVNLRESGMKLSQQRRSIEAQRNMLLPTILEPPQRKLSRTEAKQQLGLAENSILLLSIARAAKYRTVDGISFVEAHVRLLEQQDRAVLIVIGPGGAEDWSAAIDQSQGRIRVLGQTEDTAVFLQAADIYVDSFPIPSVTSLLEAGSYGIPLVTRFPYSNDSEILGSDAPGVAGNLIRVQNLEEYTIVLSRLINDEQFRASLGEATQKKILETHLGCNWQDSLDQIYLHAANLPRVTTLPASADQMCLGEPDVFLPRIFSDAINLNFYELDEMMKSHADYLPFKERVRLWLRLLKKGDLGVRGRLNLLRP